MITPIATQSAAVPIGLRSLEQNQQALGKSMERLSTGNAINSAKDDPAKLMAGINLDAALRTLDAESRAIQRESSVLSTKDAALGAAGEMIADLKGLAVQAANTGAMSDAEREALDIEAASIVRALDLTTSSASFAGEKLFDGSVADDLGSGEEGGGDYSLADIGNGLSLSSDAELIARIADRAVSDLATMRGEIGATIANDLSHRANAIDTEMTNLADARSQIMDTDFAKETAALTRAEMLSEASRFVLAFDSQRAGPGLLGVA
ncbi:MAG: flagellin [Planctomycetota bacterium]|nr:flagellin [Planctomycetota bacterium]